MHIFKTNIDLDKNQAKNFRLQNEIAFPTVTASDTGFTFFHSGFGNFYGWDGTSWLNLNDGGGGGGASTFLDLTDTPSAYTGLSFQFLRVNSGETGVEFAQVPIKAEDQGNGIGYAWANRNEAYYYTLGKDAFDLTYAASGANDKGVATEAGFSFGYNNQLPTAGNSFGGHVAFGYDNYVTGYYGNIAMGGDNALNGGYTCMQVGYQNTGNWNNSVGMGYQFGTNNTSSAYANVSVGAGLTNNWVGSVMVGAANVIDAASATAANRPAFTVGIGTISTTGGSVGVPTSRKDGFMVRYNSEILAPNTTIAIIDAESTGKQLVTKEWVNGIIPDYLLEDAVVTGTFNIDWEYDTYYLTLTGNTTFSDINLPSTGYTKTITIYMTGNFVPTFPTNWENNITGTYDGTVLNQIVIEYIKSGVYWMTINQAD
jgi:hypothetical protein